MMARLVDAVVALLVAAWFGGGVFLATVAAPAAFSGAGDPEVAAGVVGFMLSRWHWISIGAPLLALGSVRNRRKLPLVLIVIAIVLANSQWVTDNTIHEIRSSVDGAVSELSSEDPIRRRFGMLHGVSMMLLLGQLVCSAGVVAVTSARMGDNRGREPGQEAT